MIQHGPCQHSNKLQSQTTKFRRRMGFPCASSAGQSNSIAKYYTPTQTTQKTRKKEPSVQSTDQGKEHYQRVDAEHTHNKTTERQNAMSKCRSGIPKDGIWAGAATVADRKAKVPPLPQHKHQHSRLTTRVIRDGSRRNARPIFTV